MPSVCKLVKRNTVAAAVFSIQPVPLHNENARPHIYGLTQKVHLIVQRQQEIV